MPRKPKVRVQIELPSAFTDFIRDVYRRILDGDEAATTIESDDLLQCDRAFGGLYDVAGQRFGFCYFHKDDATWDFDLDAQQIAEIASGARTTMDLWQCSSGRCGCLYAREDAYCPHCDSIRHFDDYEPRLRIHHPDESPDVLAAMAHLRKIGLAIQDYHQEHGHFPPVHTRDGDGNPRHSWRALILPFLDEDALYETIDFSQPWDAERNRAAWQHRPSVYGTTDCPAPRTRCTAIVGANTIWPPTGRRRWTDIESGGSYTLAAIASNHWSVHWMQPLDPDVDAVVAEYRSHPSLLAVFVDGHVDAVEDIALDELRALLCI